MDFQFSSDYFWVVLVRLIVACLLGGVIGFEREYSRNRPAGFRTHILVSLGSCLAMLISEFVFISYGDPAVTDPARIGAQVVSGIGFLGAGAIIRHGNTVQGITTAASIWAVACIGLACGAGFYTGALITTILIWAVLMYLKRFEEKMPLKEKIKVVTIEAKQSYKISQTINDEIEKLGLRIKSIEITDDSSLQKQKIICYLLFEGKDVSPAIIAASIKGIEGVLSVTI
jgi:putative Mg2+ transporter-C (MgtC) family protein